MPRIHVLPISDETEAALAAQMRSLVDQIAPTVEQRDAIVRAWVDRVGGIAAAAVGIPGVEVYVPLRQFEVDDGADVPDLAAAVETARAAIAAVTPTRDDLVAVATEVLGADMVAALGI